MRALKSSEKEIRLLHRDVKRLTLAEIAQQLGAEGLCTVGDEYEFRERYLRFLLQCMALREQVAWYPDADLANVKERRGPACVCPDFWKPPTKRKRTIKKSDLDASSEATESKTNEDAIRRKMILHQLT